MFSLEILASQCVGTCWPSTRSTPPKLEYLEVLVFSASGFNAGGSGLKVIRIYQREFLQDLWNSAHA